MQELLNEIEQAVKNELARANRKNPLFNSPHEAYAVIKEEAEEAEYECALIKDVLSQFWSYVKCDGGAFIPSGYKSDGMALELHIAERLGMQVKTVETWIKEGE